MSSRGSALMGRTWVVPDVGIRPYIEAKVNTKTMIKLKIESKLLRALPAGLREAELGSVRKSAGGHVRKAVQKNFLELAGKTGSRKWWGKAARQTVLVQREEDGLAVVEVRQVGVRLHWKGGTVRATGRVSAVTGRPTKRLLIPFADSPLRKRDVTLAELKLPEEEMHVITSRNGCPLLVHGKRLKTRTNLTFLGKLVPQAEFEPRAEVLPHEDVLQQAMRVGALAEMKEILKKKQVK